MPTKITTTGADPRVRRVRERAPDTSTARDFCAELRTRASPLDQIPVEERLGARNEFRNLPEVAGSPLRATRISELKKDIERNLTKIRSKSQLEAILNLVMMMKEQSGENKSLIDVHVKTKDLLERRIRELEATHRRPLVRNTSVEHSEKAR